MANSVSNRWAETRCLVTGGKFCYWRHHTNSIRWWYGDDDDDGGDAVTIYRMRVPLFLLTFSKRQVNDQPARNGHSIDLIISPCGVKWHLTRTKNCTILSLYLAICCCQILVRRLQQREAQQKQLGEEYENRKTDNAWQWKLAPLHESVLSSVLIKIIIRGFEILFNRGNGNLLTSIMALVTSRPVSSKIEHRENDC
jgi:hypothetical protein